MKKEKAEGEAVKSYNQRPIQNGRIPGRITAESHDMLPEPGLQLGIYRLTQRLGKGGMGEVWKAEDTRLHRSVAIKLLPASMTGDEESRARLLREARTAGQLYHPNIATIHGIELDGDTPYIVMEYVEGASLARAIDARRLSESEIAEIGRSIADALAEAHAKGIVHRDIKPDNVILAGSRVKVLDFGIAKRYGTDAPGPPGEFVTEAGVVLGTVCYMSPEQATGKALDGRSDIFSLGVMLYEAIAGHLPFRGTTNIDTLKMIIRGEAPDLGAIAPSVSPDLVAIITRCLRKSPDERFEDAGELARELARVAAHGVTSIPSRMQLASAHEAIESAALIAQRDTEVVSQTAATVIRPGAALVSHSAPRAIEPGLEWATPTPATVKQAAEPTTEPAAAQRTKPRTAPRPGMSNVQWAIAGASFVLVLATAGGFLAAKYLGTKSAESRVAVATAPTTAIEPIVASTPATPAQTAFQPAPAVTPPTGTPAPVVKQPAAPKPAKPIPDEAPMTPPVAAEPPAAPPPPVAASPPPTTLPTTATAAYRAAMDHLEASGWHYLEASGGLTAGAGAAAPLLKQAIHLDPRHTSARLHLALTRLFGGEAGSASKGLLPLASATKGLTSDERAIAELAYLASTITNADEAEEFEDALREALEEHGSGQELAAFAEDARRLVAHRAR